MKPTIKLEIEKTDRKAELNLLKQRNKAKEKAELDKIKQIEKAASKAEVETINLKAKLAQKELILESQLRIQKAKVECNRKRKATSSNSGTMDMNSTKLVSKVKKSPNSIVAPVVAVNMVGAEAVKRSFDSMVATAVKTDVSSTAGINTRRRGNMQTERQCSCICKALITDYDICRGKTGFGVCKFGNILSKSCLQKWSCCQSCEKDFK